MRYIVVLLVLIGFFTSSVFAFEPSHTNYFSTSEFKISKVQENAYEFSIPYNVTNAVIDKIDIDCASNALIVYLDDIEDESHFIINISRDLLDMKINNKDNEFIVILDQLETNYQEIDTEIDSRTLDISLRPNSKILEIIATNVGMFPEPVPCALGNSDKSPYYQLLSPLKQFKSGIPPEQVLCKEGLEIAIKKSNWQPLCLTPDTKEKLIQRGWAEPATIVEGEWIDRSK
jgi:hypothetical protein